MLLALVGLAFGRSIQYFARDMHSCTLLAEGAFGIEFLQRVQVVYREDRTLIQAFMRFAQTYVQSCVTTS
jgi:hypothetical protein